MRLPRQGPPNESIRSYAGSAAGRSWPRPRIWRSPMNGGSRCIAARQATKLNDSKGSVAPARHREKQTLVLQSAAVDTAIRRTSPSEILVLRAQLQALSAPP